MRDREERKEKSIPIIIGAVLLLLVVGFFAVSSTAESCSRPEKQFLKVGTNTPFPPFELKMGNDIAGFDIDMAKEIAKATGRKLVIKDFTEFDALLPTIKSGALDMVASSVTINDARSEVVDFSDPYYESAQGILMKKGAKFDGALTGLKVAYQYGTTSQSWAEEQKIAAETVFKDMNLGIQLLRVGAVDAIIMDKPAAQNFAKANPDLVFAGAIETEEKYGFAVQKSDPDKLLPVINKLIAEMKQDGRYQKLLEKWFGGGQ